MDAHLIEKLALAMGWKLIDGVWHGKGSTWDSLMFDPENNANDDYAVLEWMRRNDADLFVLDQEITAASLYTIGDYARAALKVLNPPTT